MSQAFCSDTIFLHGKMKVHDKVPRTDGHTFSSPYHKVADKVFRHLHTQMAGDMAYGKNAIRTLISARKRPHSARPTASMADF
jgi:hypothetical protein